MWDAFEIVLRGKITALIIMSENRKELHLMIQTCTLRRKNKEKQFKPKINKRKKMHLEQKSITWNRDKVQIKLNSQVGFEEDE